MIFLQIESLKETVVNFSIQDLINGDTSFIVPVFYLVISVAIYSILIWHFYRYIAKRDCFNIPNTNHSKAISIFKYFLIFPFVAFLYFAGFSTMLLFLTRNYSIAVILSTSFGLIVAIRLTAYYSEDLSKDVAKMLPFALLALVLVDPSYFHVKDIVLKFEMLPLFFSQVVQYIILIVFVEWFLRICLSGKQWIISKKGSPSMKRRSMVTT